MRINTNISALQAQRAVSEHTKKVEETSGKLSSGLRVRTAADDAATLSIGTKLKSEIRSQNQAIRNSNDVISEFQVAEGSLNEISSMLIRLKELSVQAANGVLQDEERAMLNFEYMSTYREIERTIQSTKYRGNYSFRPNVGEDRRQFQVGIQNTSASRVEMNHSDLTLSEFNLEIVDSSIANAEEARLNLKYLDQALDKVSKHRAYLGAIQSRVENTISNLDTARTAESNAVSKMMDADIAHEASAKLLAENKLNAATSILGQANNLGAVAMKLLKD